ncbi:MAG: hypothetical protein Q8O76_08710, partial [Chloroflexota bacterium]|nr:hypothetical protein [Chloroflexota bacterium]
EQGRLTVTSAAADVGDVETSIPVQLEGEVGWIAFSSKYLLGYLHKREGVMVVELNDPSNPGVFIHRGEKVVLMPMFIRGEGPSNPAGQPEPSTAETPPDPQADATAESPPAAEGEASDVEQDEGPPPPEAEAPLDLDAERSRLLDQYGKGLTVPELQRPAEPPAPEAKPKRSRKRKAKTTE